MSMLRDGEPVYIEVNFCDSDVIAAILLPPKEMYFSALGIGKYSGYRLSSLEHAISWDTYGHEASQIAIRLGLIAPREGRVFTGGDGFSKCFSLLPARTDILPYLQEQLDEFKGIAFSKNRGGVDNLDANSIAKKIATQLMSNPRSSQHEFLCLLDEIHDKNGRIAYLLRALDGYELFICGCLGTRIFSDEQVGCIVERICLLDQLRWPDCEGALMAAKAGLKYRSSKQPELARLHRVPVATSDGRTLSILDAIDEALKNLRAKYPVLVKPPC